MISAQRQVFYEPFGVRSPARLRHLGPDRVTTIAERVVGGVQ